jgi:hypothetical protein
MAAKTFWQWYDKELPSGDDALTFQAAWDAAVESVEENGNSLQQLKAEIAALAEELLSVYKTGSDEYVVSVIDKLRQLSAV